MISRFFARRDALSALRFPAYRWFMASRFAAAMTMQMRSVAVGWLVYNMTGSAQSLGWVAVAGSLATFVLAPIGGVLADRVEKRTILILTRFVLVVTAFLMAGLYYAGVMVTWHLTIFSVTNGMVFAFMMPAQETIPSDLVDKESLLNALSLGTVVEGALGIVGATLAGWMLAGVGAGGVFIVMGLLFSSVCLALLKLPKVGARKREPGESFVTTMVEGVRYVGRDASMLALLGLSLSTNLFFSNYRTFLPALAKDMLGMGARGLGLLTSAAGLGMLANSILMAGMGNTRHKGRLLLGAGLVGALFLALLVTVRVQALSYVIVFVLGAMGNMIRVMVNTMLQTRSDPAYRARVNSLSRTLGSATALWMIPAGAIVDNRGLPTLMLLQAVILALVFGGLVVWAPKMRSMS